MGLEHSSDPQNHLPFGFACSSSFLLAVAAPPSVLHALWCRDGWCVTNTSLVASLASNLAATALGTNAAGVLRLLAECASSRPRTHFGIAEARLIVK